jgi:hypothetical protein
VQRLFGYLADLMEEEVEVELCWRVAVFLLRIHHSQVMACRALLPVLTRMQGALKQGLRKYREAVAMNAAGLRLLKREIDADMMAYVVDDQPARQDKAVPSGARKKAKA